MTAILFFIAHLLGDYEFQNEWMATTKTSKWWPAIVHGFVYTLCYLMVTDDIWSLLVIGITHAIIDHYRLVKRFIWLRNNIAPKLWRYHWGPSGEFDTGTGPYGERYDRNSYPPHVAQRIAADFWLMVIADNTIHLLINYAAIRWL